MRLTEEQYNKGVKKVLSTMPETLTKVQKMVGLPSVKQARQFMGNLFGGGLIKVEPRYKQVWMSHYLVTDKGKSFV